MTIAVSGSHGSTDELGTGVQGGISAIPLGVAVGATVGVATGAVVGACAIAVAVGSAWLDSGVTVGVALGAGSVTIGDESHATSVDTSNVIRAVRAIIVSPYLDW